MEKWIKIDPHVHSKGVSLCSKLTCGEIIDSKRALGYDGAVLTNHCQRWYYPAEEHKYFIERVIEEFSRGKAYADKVGFRWYLGLEVSLDEPLNVDYEGNELLLSDVLGTDNDVVYKDIEMGVEKRDAPRGD